MDDFQIVESFFRQCFHVYSQRSNPCKSFDAAFKGAVIRLWLPEIRRKYSVYDAFEIRGGFTAFTFDDWWFSWRIVMSAHRRDYPMHLKCTRASAIAYLPRPPSNAKGVRDYTKHSLDVSLSSIKREVAGMYQYRILHTPSQHPMVLAERSRLLLEGVGAF